MTDLEKKKVVKLRTKGVHYSAIAEELNTTIATVNSYCTRNKIPTDHPVCPECMSSLPKGRKVFCSDECRIRWWRRNRNHIYSRTYTYKCAYCGEEFTRTRNYHPKYCSHSCYIKDRFGGE